MQLHFIGKSNYGLLPYIFIKLDINHLVEKNIIYLYFIFKPEKFLGMMMRNNHAARKMNLRIVEVQMAL